MTCSRVALMSVLESWTCRKAYYIVMNLLEGPTLQGWMTSLKTAVPERTCADLAQQMLSAVHYLHRVVGAVHRDVKPALSVQSEILTSQETYSSSTWAWLGCCPKRSKSPAQRTSTMLLLGAHWVGSLKPGVDSAVPARTFGGWD